MYNDDMYQVMPYMASSLANGDMFKQMVRERFIDMVDNCKLFYSNGDMYVQADKDVYRKVCHEILRRFENIAFINIHYCIVEMCWGCKIMRECPYSYESLIYYCSDCKHKCAMAEDTLSCQEVKEVVIAMYQLAQYEKLVGVLAMHNSDVYMEPITVSITYTNGEILSYSDIGIFNIDFFKSVEGNECVEGNELYEFI